VNGLKKKLDHLLGSVTMYKLVLVLLIVLTAYALILSLAGLVFYSPLEILATGGIAVAVSVLSSWALGRLFRTKAHLESAAITGLLLLFVLVPSLDAVELGGIAVAALVASASKFLLAVRGRHVFNPAAIGALVAIVLGLQFNGWWASNVYLLPVVALSALIILYRTRRLIMGLVFVAVVFALSLVFHSSQPSYAFSSIATVFFVGFMLSEPLTLPPRRWQQLVLAVIVGALVAVPTFQIVGTLWSSPQFALVVGNLLAFLVGQRRGLALSLVAKQQLTPTTWEFAFQPKHPVRFHAGQYLELALPHGPADLRGQRRVFSISSAPAEDSPITVGVKVSERSSSFKTAMLALEPGDTVRATSVGGDFLLPSDATMPVLLVAGGIGITPFASQLAHETGRGRDTVVVYAVLAGEELAYRAQLEASDARVIVIAPTAPADLPADWTYAGSDRLTAESLANLVPDVTTRHAFVSGPPALVDDVRGILRSLKARRISTDYFSGY